MTDEELWAESRTNLGLEELLVQERTIFQTLGVMHSKLVEYNNNLATLCPAGFPAISEWADSSSDAEIGVVCGCEGWGGGTALTPPPPPPAPHPR